MSRKKLDEPYDFSPETVERKRKFPVFATIGLCVLILAQVVCALVICFYTPEPQDVIEDYTVYISPREDGSLDIKYCFTWTPLDTTEDLTWVEIGMANESFTFLKDSSDNIKRLNYYSDDEGYCYAEVYFDRPYRSGETFDFYFTVNQRCILSEDKVGKLYAFVPGWFNYTPVKHYAFYFEKYGDISFSNTREQDSKWLKWEGSLNCGDYVRMLVHYKSFNASAVEYEAFDESGCYDGLESDKLASTAIMIIIILAAVTIEIYIVDSYVSYGRGRGFLRGYGHPIHVYGHVNPRYTKAEEKYNSVHGSHGRGSGGGGRGCACACACACAGGGRAGCSQKDTYHNEKDARSVME